MRGRTRRARVAGPVLVAAAWVLATGCKKTPTLGFGLSLPGDVAGEVAWLEVGVFSGSSCATLGPQLAGGVPASGYTERIAWASRSSTPPLLQNLPRARYSIAATARAEDCSVLAIGCVDVNLASAGSVEVTLDDAPKPFAGACVAGSVCNDARCAPGSAATDPGLGAGCSLALVGAGPLADPLLIGGGTIVSAPAVVATDTGFLIGYREDDLGDGVARITVVPIDPGGATLPPQQTQEPACTESELSDATGLVFQGTTGLLAEARAGCGGSGGIDLYPVSDLGAFGTSGFSPNGMDRIQLSTAHSLTTSVAGTFLAFVLDDVATVAPITGSTVAPGVVIAAAGRSTDVWIAASDTAFGLVTAGTEDEAVAPATDDAGPGTAGGGADDGGAPSVDATAPDAAAPTSPSTVLRVNVVPASDAGVPLASLPAPVTFPGTWASVAAQAGRVLVASDGADAGAPVAFRAFDVGTAGPSVTSSFTTDDTGPVLYADVALNQDHAFFAVERPGAIALVAFEHATTTPTPLRTIELAQDPRVPSIATVRDGRVAVVATDTAVLVAWTTQESLGASDPAGGYALFACTSP